MSAIDSLQQWLKNFNFIICLVLLAIPFVSQSVFAQIQDGTYSSGYYVEMRWNDARKEYEKLKTYELASGFSFDSDGISFRKGSSVKWLYNRWEYKGELSQKREIASDWYLDERGQKIVIDYDNKTLLYYHGYDNGRKVYTQLTLYKNLKMLESDSDDAEEDNDKFRVDMEYVAVYDSKTKKWSDWEEGFNSFVINYNGNGDILHIKPSGKQAVYRNISKQVERKKTQDGKEYQIVEVIDEDGEACSFQIFDDYKIGIKLIYKNAMVQFSQ
jgi:hypothetical protein